MKSDRIKEILMGKLLGTTPTQALFLLQHLEISLELTGDVCEFGVAQGATAALIAHEILDTSKKLWLFDSFEGLPKFSEHDTLLHDVLKLGNAENYEGSMKCDSSEVINRLSEIDFPIERVKLIIGDIRKTIWKLDTVVCFAYIDVDLYESTLAILKYLDVALSVEGIIVVDDYQYFTSGPANAVGDFLMEETEHTWGQEIKNNQIALRKTR